MLHAIGKTALGGVSVGLSHLPSEELFGRPALRGETELRMRSACRSDFGDLHFEIRDGKLPGGSHGNSRGCLVKMSTAHRLEINPLL